MLPPSPRDHHISASGLHCGEDVSDADTWIPTQSPDPGSSSPPPPPSSCPSPLPSNEDDAADLIDLESDHMPRPDYLRRCRDHSIDVTARQDSINWILRVLIDHQRVSLVASD